MKNIFTVLLLVIGLAGFGQNTFKYPTHFYNDVTMQDSTTGNPSRSPIWNWTNNYGRYFQNFRWSLQNHDLTYDSVSNFYISNGAYADGFFYCSPSTGTVFMGDVAGNVNNTYVNVQDNTSSISMRGLNGISFTGNFLPQDSAQWDIGTEEKHVDTIFIVTAKIAGGSPSAGKILTSLDSEGTGTWGNGALPAVKDTVATLTGLTVSLTNNKSNVIVASNTIVDVELAFPTGVDGDVLIVNNTRVITTLTVSGTGSSTITAVKISATRLGGATLFNNIGGNWY